MRKKLILSFFLVNLVIFISCRKEHMACGCYLGPDFGAEISVVDSAGHDLLSDNTSFIMRDTIYESRPDDNHSYSFSKFTASQAIFDRSLYTNHYNQKVLFVNIASGIIVQFGNAKKDTITGKFNSLHASQIFVNGVLKYDDNKPAHPGEPWFTLVK